jgi:hypothetical protein
MYRRVPSHRANRRGLIGGLYSVVSGGYTLLLFALAENKKECLIGKGLRGWFNSPYSKGGILCTLYSGPPLCWTPNRELIEKTGHTHTHTHTYTHIHTHTVHTHTHTHIHIYTYYTSIRGDRSRCSRADTHANSLATEGHTRR